MHSKYVVVSKEPTVHKRGMFITFYYPDGTTQSDGRYVPDFKKMQEIRLKAESKKMKSLNVPQKTARRAK